jgi:hypothetical protein
MKKNKTKTKKRSRKILERASGSVELTFPNATTKAYLTCSLGGEIAARRRAAHVVFKRMSQKDDSIAVFHPCVLLGWLLRYEEIVIFLSSTEDFFEEGLP